MGSRECIFVPGKSRDSKEKQLVMVLRTGAWILGPVGRQLYGKKGKGVSSDVRSALFFGKAT